jgi:hypothetical protein
MSNADEDELTPKLHNLVDAVVGMGGVVDQLKDGHGGLLWSFLQHKLVDYPAVAAALDAIAPVNATKERFDAMYTAIDYAAKHHLY